MSESRRLSASDRETAQKCIELLERLGESVGGWVMKTIQARQQGFTATVVFDNKVGPYLAQEFASMMEEAPAIMLPYLRRILKIDDELKANSSDVFEIEDESEGK